MKLLNRSSSFPSSEQLEKENSIVCMCFRRIRSALGTNSSKVCDPIVTETESSFGFGEYSARVVMRKMCDADIH